MAEEISNKTCTYCGVNYTADADQELSVQIHDDFEQKKYDQCLKSLKKLLEKRPHDHKVIHNLAVTDYLLSKQQNTDVFNKVMADINRAAQINIHDLTNLDDVDSCVVIYNQAVVLFHMHQYNSAISMMESVLPFLDSLEETNPILVKHICFLLMELYLCVYEPKKLSSTAGYIETSLLSETKRCERHRHRESGKKEDNTVSSKDELFKSRLSLFRARCFAMMKSSKACKREIKNLISASGGEQNLPAFFLKSQMEYQRGNYQKAIKLLRSIVFSEDTLPYFKETGTCLPAIFFNNLACIHFYMGKSGLGQYYSCTAIKHFKEQLEVVTDKKVERKINSRPLHLMSLSTRHQLIYTLALNYFQSRRFSDAFDCFTEVVQSYPVNPRIWLRIAECCMYLYKPDGFDEYTTLSKKSYLKAVYGVGSHTKVLLQSQVSNKVSIEDLKLGESAATEKPTLHFAMLCLRNALFIINQHENTVKESISSRLSVIEDTSNLNAEDTFTPIPTLPSNSLGSAETQSLKNSVLAASSYVSLCVGDVLLAHKYAIQLLAQPFISQAHKFLAKQYASEALLTMDRITEALDHLNNESIVEVQLSHPSNSPELSLKLWAGFDSSNEKSDDGSRPVGSVPDWIPDKIETAKFVMQYNLAVMYAVREEWSKALECLTQINPDMEIPEEARSLYIYIQCHRGSIAEVRKYVKQSQVFG